MSRSTRRPRGPDGANGLSLQPLRGASPSAFLGDASWSKGGDDGLDRRTFLSLSTLAGAAVVTGLGAQTARAAAAGGEATFGSVSSFVTGQSSRFDPVLVERAYKQMVALDPKFDERIATLSDAISASKATTIDAFLADNPSDDLRQTMTTITGIWYLGYTGTPDPSKMTDDAKFVTYRDALMWQATGHITPIPTYSQHDHNYWANPPTDAEKG
ncbi:twin-arginine translocation signal domain-containing protein [Thioclava sp. BHET1]|nr:twin-arginine translocation signal domain-containing protein [Thioclava sp. BHET1]